MSNEFAVRASLTYNFFDSRGQYRVDLGSEFVCFAAGVQKRKYLSI